jgi:hypothetical protein
VELIPITGVVTLGSKPLANAGAIFSPANERPSARTTDAEGPYELFCTVNEPGVLPGSHTVSISTFMMAALRPGET